MSKMRNSNIELLRLLLIFMIVILHFNNEDMGGAFSCVKYNWLDNYLLHFFTSISIGAVNCFMIVSGYFLYANKNVNFGKVADILVIVSFYRVLCYLLSLQFGYGHFSIKYFILSLLPANYFAIYYVVCYLLSPFIARIWNEIENRSANFLIVMLLLVFIIVPTILDIAVDMHILNEHYSFSPIALTGNGAGYTVIQFLTMLSLGMWLRKRKLTLPSWILIMGYLFSSLIMTSLVVKLQSLYYYSSIFTVASSVCLFLLFCKLNFQNNYINFIAKSCFAIFCIHTSPFTIEIWRHFITVEHFQKGLLSTILWMLVCVGGMFIICMVLSIFMRLIFGKLKTLFISRFPEYAICWKTDVKTI